MTMKQLYEQIANKAADIIGFSRTDLETFERVKGELFDNSINGGDSLKNYLTYRYFEPKSKNFLLTDNRAGFLLEIWSLS